MNDVATDVEPAPEKASQVLTGNPFVDWGLSIAGAIADLESVEALTNEHLKNVVGDGIALARRHQRLKAFIPVFGSNTPLHNPKRKGQRPGEAHVRNYASLLVRIRDAMGHEATDRMARELRENDHAWRQCWAELRAIAPEFDLPATLTPEVLRLDLRWLVRGSHAASQRRSFRAEERLRAAQLRGLLITCDHMASAHVDRCLRLT